MVWLAFVSLVRYKTLSIVSTQTQSISILFVCLLGWFAQPRRTPATKYMPASCARFRTVEHMVFVSSVDIRSTFHLLSIFSVNCKRARNEKDSLINKYRARAYACVHLARLPLFYAAFVNFEPNKTWTKLEKESQKPMMWTTVRICYFFFFFRVFAYLMVLYGCALFLVVRFTAENYKAIENRRDTRGGGWVQNDKLYAYSYQ